MEGSTLIPLAGISVGVIVPLAVFYWQYHEVKNKNETITEIAKSIDDPAKLEELMTILDERKKEPIDYRRGGIITIFVGIGLYLLGFVVMGSCFRGIWGETLFFFSIFLDPFPIRQKHFPTYDPPPPSAMAKKAAAAPAPKKAKKSAAKK